MGLFDFFRRKKKAERRNAHTTISIPDDRVDDVVKALGRIDTTDYLGKAAVAGDKARKAIKSGNLDKAWEHYHKQKQLYAGHAKRSEFTPAQALALDGSVSESLANVLRLEGKHQEALVHLIYSVATSPRPSKAQEKKITAYFNRAKLSKVSIEEVERFVEKTRNRPDLRAIQLAIARWGTAK